MNKLMVRLQKARLAIVSGDAEAALNEIQEFSVAAERFPPEDAETKSRIKSALAELEVLAKASMEGAKMAVDQIRDIVTAAQTLQTYDDTGQRRSTRTAARIPRRF